MEISKVDTNFKVSVIAGQELNFYDVHSAPFVIEGLPWRNGTEFNRNPPNVNVNSIKDDMLAYMPEVGEENARIWGENLLWLSKHTSGAAIRFRTNSKGVAVRAKLRESSDMSHMTRLGSAGFDLFRRESANEPLRFINSVPVEPKELNEHVERMLHFPTNEKMSDYVLNLPLYGGVETLEIGLSPDAVIEPPTPHRIEKPVLFYGSSITQGGCASRPGNMYPSLLCRELDVEQINLGFSGNAKGQPMMAEAIASLDLSCFVMDYDHNAPSAEHLKKTHYNFYRIIREKHPELPIIMISRPDFRDDNDPRNAIVRESYEKAVANGDKKVWFIPGNSLFGFEDYDACTVDGCHPNDLGFYRMFKRVLPVIKEALGLK